VKGCARGSCELARAGKAGKVKAVLKVLGSSRVMISLALG
jgi:hypothetical protein